ncbi:hypothetical protein HPG69_002055 [Diceros bicornis minor]|uniref:Uncharacterized protein n=1 Tax=Diceros bicornis minor TaxID=77932 RepID=A0A7J7FCI9_DICBM|nr:hypothetical protein HPG69_002055 [Diceros bicornis minor]
MEGGNHSVVSEFVFLGLTHSWKIQLLLLVFSSVLYVASVTGNILIVFSALSTLSAHITVVLLFFGPTMFVYTWPHPNSQMDKFLALFDAVLTPFLNPVIYTFRNKNMKAAMKRVCTQFVIYRKIS